VCRHGGILCDFLSSWYPRQVASVQHGVGSRGARSTITGEFGGRAANAQRCGAREKPRRRPRRGERTALAKRLLRRPHGGIRKDRSTVVVGGKLGRYGPAPARQFSKASCARAASKNGWRSTAIHISRTSTAATARALQKRFFGHFLKGEDTGWDRQPRVSLNIRYPGERFALRAKANGRSRGRNGRNIS